MGTLCLSHAQQCSGLTRGPLYRLSPHWEDKMKWWLRPDALHVPICIHSPAHSPDHGRTAEKVNPEHQRAWPQTETKSRRQCTNLQAQVLTKNKVTPTVTWTFLPKIIIVCFRGNTWPWSVVNPGSAFKNYS